MVYIDDVVVFSKTFDEHIVHLDWAFRMFDGANIKFGREKCHFFQTQLRLLGRVVNSEGVLPDPSLVEDIVNYPTSQTAKHVRSFVALVNYYSSFIQDF